MDRSSTAGRAGHGTEAHDAVGAAAGRADPGPPPSPAPFLPIGTLIGFAALAGAFRIKAYDLFWHLAAGRWIVGHGRLPRSDPFRFTSDGAVWVDHEWLFQVIVFWLERAVGLAGLVGVRSLVAVGLAALLLTALRRAGAPAAWSLFPVLAAVLGGRPRLFLRPELGTLLALALLLTLLQELRRAEGRRRLRWAAGIVLLIVPWANAHPGALAAPPVAAAFLLGARLPGGTWRPRGATEPIPWWLVVGLPAALTAGLLLTPHGWHIFEVPLAIGSSLEGLPGVNPEWLPLWDPRIARDSTYLFAAAAALVALAFVSHRRARASGDRLDPATGLAAAALAALATTSIRHQALFYVGAAFFAGECLATLHRRVPSDPATSPARARRLRLLATALCLLAAVWVVVPPTRGPLAPRQGRYHLGFGLERNRFPVHLADEVEEWPGLGNLYNNVAWGGYLLWRLYPPRQIFSDGRNEVDPELLRELAAARRSSRAWRDLLERHRIDGAVVRYEDRLLEVLEPPAEVGGPPTVTRRTPHAVLFPREEFALVDWDDAGMLLVRRTPEREERLAREEYRAVHPEDRRHTLVRAERDAAFRARVVRELRRRLAEDPPSERARRLYEALVEPR